jgi:hypothetical protein
MSRRSTRKRGGGKVSYSKLGIAKQMGISVNQLQAKLNKAARKGKKHSTHRRALLARMTSTRGIPLSRLTRLGLDPTKIQTATRLRKQTTPFTAPGSTSRAASSTRRATTAAENSNMGIDPQIAEAMEIRDTLIAQLRMSPFDGPSNKVLQEDFKKILRTLKRLPITTTYPKDSANRREIGLLRQQSSDKTIPGKFHIKSALKARGTARSAEHYIAEEADDPDIDALILGVQGL